MDCHTPNCPALGSHDKLFSPESRVPSPESRVPSPESNWQVEQLGLPAASAGIFLKKLLCGRGSLPDFLPKAFRFLGSARSLRARENYTKKPPQLGFTIAAKMLIMIILLTQGGAALAESCKPLIVFYNGFLNQDLDKLLGKRNFYTTCKEYNPPKGIRKRCQSWSKIGGGYETDFIKDHWNSTSSATPIILIGYSYGGDTAYDIAKSLPKNYEPTLITLDPVGKKGLDSSLAKPTSGEWITVYTKKPWSLHRCDLIARAGVRYRKQSNADKNIIFDGNHCDVDEMFDKVKPFIEKKISCLQE